MRKALLYSLLALFFFSSCKKEHSNKPLTSQKTYKINFNVSGFTQTIVNSVKGKMQVNGLKTDSVALSADLDQLYYYVFGVGNSTFRFLSQDSTASNFGSISDNLPAGTYTVIIGAGKKGFLSYKDDLSVDRFMSYTDADYNSKPWSDTFYDKFQLSVSGDINQNVTLHRIVGKVEVNLLDTIPANADKITITVNKENFLFMIYPTEALAFPNTLISTAVIPASAKGFANYKFDTIIANTTTPFTVTINCYDASQKIIATAIVNNVTCQQNTRTILSGKLFGSANGFNINLGPWNPTPINIPF